MFAPGDGGVPAPGECTWSQRGCTWCWGVPDLGGVPGPGGVSAPGGVCFGGCLLPGRPAPGGGLLWGGVPGLGGVRYSPTPL